MMEYPLVDVLDLIREHLDHNRRSQQHQQPTNGPQPRNSGKEKIVYRKADDTWF